MIFSDCDKKLASGENSKVGTGDYVASSNRDAGHPPGKAELNSNKAWCALTNDDQQWVQVPSPSFIDMCVRKHPQVSVSHPSKHKTSV